eukprot:20489-Heterococcus_DN1.PRE.2
MAIRHWSAKLALYIKRISAAILCNLKGNEWRVPAVKHSMLLAQSKQCSAHTCGGLEVPFNNDLQLTVEPLPVSAAHKPITEDTCALMYPQPQQCSAVRHSLGCSHQQPLEHLLEITYGSSSSNSSSDSNSDGLLVHEAAVVCVCIVHKAASIALVSCYFSTRTR